MNALSWRLKPFGHRARIRRPAFSVHNQPKRPNAVSWPFTRSTRVWAPILATSTFQNIHIFTIASLTSTTTFGLIAPSPSSIFPLVILLLAMAPPPKTPSRHRSRSETKTPLTASMFGVNAAADASNPFIVPSRPVSPIKRATSSSLQVSESLQRQASMGVIRRGGVESRLDVVTRDYVPPKSEKRSRSQPTVSLQMTLRTV